MLEGNGVYFGFILAVLVGAVIIGIKSIANVTEKIVPFILFHMSELPFIIVANYDQYLMCLLGFSILPFLAMLLKVASLCVAQGFRRAAFSNEAGVGSEAIVSSPVKTNEPVTEGIVALLEPFIDTVVICTMTAIVIITGRHTGYDLEGAQLTSSVFNCDIWFPDVIGGCHFLICILNHDFVVLLRFKVLDLFIW